MITIKFMIHDGRTSTGYREISHAEPSLELALDYMHKYHNRSTGWYWYEEDGKCTRAYDEIGVLL